MTDHLHGLEPGTCRSCRARILWGLTERNRRMPLDVEPELGGNVEALGRGHVRVVAAHPLVPRYVSHFASCPNASAHRGRSKGKPREPLHA